MRKALAARSGQRASFRGTFERFGVKSGWRGGEEQQRTVLLTDIRDADTGAPVCRHLWFTCRRGFAALDLAPGDVVRFDARVRGYVKGYFGRREDIYKPIERDYRLSHPTKIEKVIE